MKNHDNEMERAILGCMMLDRSIHPNIMRAVSEADFYDLFNRELFRKIIQIGSTGRGVDIMSLNSATANKNPAYVASLTDVVPSAANWNHYTERVKKLAMTRRFNELLEESKDATPETITSKLGAFIAAAAGIAEETGGDDVRAAREYILAVVDDIEKAIKTRGAISGYDCGINNINDITDGIQKEYIIIGARASIGKTALAMNIAKNIARKNIGVGYFSLEMSSKALLKRVLADMASVPARTLSNGMMSDAMAGKIASQGMDLAEYPLYPIDSTRGKFEKIVSISRYMVRCLGVKVIIIDHASLMKYENRKIQRHEQFSEMSNELQNLQRELDVPIILLAQLGRESEGRKPTLADLRESGGFEQDADQVWLMHRDRAKTAEDTNIPTEINVAKNRNGACGNAELLFQPQFVRFVDKARARDDRL
jgi:replicative DNA helicase